MKEEIGPETRMIINYVNAILDGMIALRKKEISVSSNIIEANVLFGEHHLLQEVYGSNTEKTSKAKLTIMHSVSDCPHEVLLHCEEVLLKAGKKLPPKPMHMQDASRSFT